MPSIAPLANYLILELDKTTIPNSDNKISVNPIVSEVAGWYEKFRNAIDYQEDDVLLRTAIERILKRRLLLGGTPSSIALPLVKELLWARYFPENEVPEPIVRLLELKIDLYLRLQLKINKLYKMNKATVYTWIIQLLSSEISKILNPNIEKELISNFIYQIYYNKIKIEDDSDQTKNAQVFIASKRAFSKENLPLIRYHLFLQICGGLEENNLENIASDFLKIYYEIENQLNYPLRNKIYTFIKNKTVPFFVLENIFHNHRGKIRKLIMNPEDFNLIVLNSCSDLYKGIKAKVNRAIIRGFIFIFITKAIFALTFEGSFESIVYGKVIWSSIAMNTIIPPILMVIAGLLIKTPGKENSQKILRDIQNIIYHDGEENLKKLVLKKSPAKINPFLNGAFVILWLLALILSFGTVIFTLTKLHFNPASQVVFIFFLTIISFISYRINQTAHMYTMPENKQNLRSVTFDFFFMPFIHLGRDLTENISKLNLLIFVFNFIIETPFKSLFSFFEEWFLYLRTQREKLD